MITRMLLSAIRAARYGLLRALPMAFVAIASFVHLSPVHAQSTTTWNGGAGSGDWSTAGNWSSGAPSTTGTWALTFSGTTQTSSTNTIGGTNSTIMLSSLTFSNTNSTVFALTRTNSRTLTLVDGATVSTASGGTGNNSISIPLTLNGSATFNTAGQGLVVSLNSGGGAITKVGTGVLTLSTSSDQNWNITGGTLYANPNVALSGTLTWNGGSTLTISSANNSAVFSFLQGMSIRGFSGVIANFSSGTFNVPSAAASDVTVTLNATSGTGAIQGVIQDNTSKKVALSLNQNNTTWRLSGSNTHSGGTTINSGATLLANNASALGRGLATINGNLSVNGLTATVYGLAGTTGVVGSATNASVLSVDTTGQNTTFSGTVGNGSGTMGLSVLGTGKLTLGGANTYTGATTISGGTLALGSAGSIASSGTITVGSAGSTGAILDLTAMSSSYAFGSGQRVQGIGTINIGAGKTVSTAGIWSPGNSIGSNAVTGNLTLTGTSQFELGTPGTSTSASGTSDFTAVSGTLAVGGNLTLLDNANAGGLGSYGAGSYRLFTAPTLSGTFASVTAPAGASTTRVAMVYTSGTSSGQGVFANVYNLAVGSVSSGTTVNLGLVHAGGAFMAQGISIANAAAAGSFSEGLNASVTGSTGNAASGGTAITNLVAGGTSSTLTANLADTATGGVKNGTLTIGYQSNGSTTSGLATVSAGSQVVNLTGSVFSGTGVWNVNGGGSWGSGASANWTSVESVSAAPGTFAGYDNTDVARFGSALTGGTASILLDGASPSLASLIFSNTTGRYVLDQGSGGSLTLAAASGKPTIDVISSGLHEIKTTILGTSGLQKIGGGTLMLSGSSAYSGGTDITAGTLAVNGSLGGAVNVGGGAALSGSGVLNGLVTVAGGGILAPGNSPGTLTMTAGLSLDSGSILNFELNASDNTIGGGVNDLIDVTGNFTLDGILNVTGLGDFSTVADFTSWRLFNYASGTFTNNGLTLGTMPSVGSTGKYFQIDTSTPNQVNLVIVPEPGAIALAGIGIGLATWLVLRGRMKDRRQPVMRRS